MKHMMVLMNFAKELTQALGSTIAKVHPVFKVDEVSEGRTVIFSKFPVEIIEVQESPKK